MFNNFPKFGKNKFRTVKFKFYPFLQTWKWRKFSSTSKFTFKAAFSLGRFHQHFAQFFIENKMRSFFWCMAFSKWRINLANFIKHIGWTSLAQFEAECWWNWTVNSSPNAVRRQLFTWRKKFGEMIPFSPFDVSWEMLPNKSPSLPLTFPHT